MRLFCRNIGEKNKEKLLILHGLLGLSDHWVSLAKTLSEHFHCIIPDLRNHGKSAHHHVFNYEVMLDDIMELLLEQNIDKCNVLGHSMGGKLAMYLALHYPEKIRKMVIADISPTNYSLTRYSDLFNTLQSVNIEEITKRSDIEQYLTKQLPEKRLIWFVMKNIKMVGREKYAWKSNVKTIIDNLENIFGFGKFELQKCNQPCLFLQGANSDFILKEHKPLIKKLFPNSEIRTIDGAGHWLHVDKPETFLRLVTEFFV